MSAFFKSNLTQYLKAVDAAVQREWFAEMRRTGERWGAYYKRVTEQWAGKPQFDIKVTFNGRKYSLTIVPKGEFADRWIWVDEGTDPHIIRPKKPGYPLRFKSGYNAKTAPIAQANVGDGRSFGSTVSKYFVSHPGNEPREFSSAAARQIEPGFLDGLDNAVIRGINRV